MFCSVINKPSKPLGINKVQTNWPGHSPAVVVASSSSCNGRSNCGTDDSHEDSSGCNGRANCDTDDSHDDSSSSSSSGSDAVAVRPTVATTTTATTTRTTTTTTTTTTPCINGDCNICWMNDG